MNINMEEGTEKKDQKKNKIIGFFKFKWLLKFFGMRQTKYGSNTFLVIVVMIGILV